MNNQPPPLTGKKILIVDDDEVVVKALSMKLAKSGYQVITASEPSDAVQSVRKDRPDLILLDISFPPDVTGTSWDGFRVAEWIHRMEWAKAVPIVIITGGDREKYMERAESVGAAAFFHKPINNDELLTVIRKTLDEWASKAETGPDQQG
jgi:CheY-like chemotaxis protein